MYLKATLSHRTVTTLAGKWNAKKSLCTLQNRRLFSDAFVKDAVGLKKYQGIKYNTVARNITGLIPSGSTGINHGEKIKFRFIRATFDHRDSR